MPTGNTCGNDFAVRLEVESTATVPEASLQVGLQTVFGARVVTGWTEEVGQPVSLVPGKQAFECRFRNLRLRPGHAVMLNLNLSGGNMAVIDAVDNAAVYDVTAAPADQHLSTNADQGAVVCDYSWRTLPA